MDINSTNRLLDTFARQHFPQTPDQECSFEDYIHLYGSPSEAIIYSTLYMPQLTKVGDSILLQTAVDTAEERSRFQEAAKSHKSLSALEASYNFVEVAYLFAKRDELTVEEEVLLAHRIKDAWSGWLMIQHPDRTFKVEVLSPEETGSSVGVHFYQKRSP